MDFKNSICPSNPKMLILDCITCSNHSLDSSPSAKLFCHPNVQTDKFPKDISTSGSLTFS